MKELFLLEQVKDWTQMNLSRFLPSFEKDKENSDRKVYSIPSLTRYFFSQMQ